MLTWAQSIITANPDREVIVATHEYLDTAGNHDNRVWTNLIQPNCQIILVVNGHLPGEAQRTDTNACGEAVHQVLTDYQGRANGGDGWLRYYTFTPASNTIEAYTYSATLNQFETDANSRFSLAWPAGGGTPGPFTAIGTAPVSGGSASIAWPGRAASTAYEWYATVSDGLLTTTGATWSFTTGSSGANQAPVAVADSYTTPLNTTLTVAAPGVLSNDSDPDGNPITAVKVTNPAHGTATLGANGALTYVPTTGYSGADSFTYKANDGSARLEHRDRQPDGHGRQPRPGRGRGRLRIAPGRDPQRRGPGRPGQRHRPGRQRALGGQGHEPQPRDADPQCDRLLHLRPDRRLRRRRLVHLQGQRRLARLEHGHRDT